jgi:predicted DNA-binding antitoxin AbrB/MazE fold protein
MTLQGHIKNGAIVPDVPVVLPEGAAVQIEVVEKGSEAEIVESRKTLAERFASIIGAARGLPADLADQHDHYLHGTPKK